MHRSCKPRRVNAVFYAHQQRKSAVFGGETKRTKGSSGWFKVTNFYFILWKIFNFPHYLTVRSRTSSTTIWARGSSWSRPSLRWKSSVFSKQLISSWRRWGSMMRQTWPWRWVWRTPRRSSVRERRSRVQDQERQSYQGEGVEGGWCGGEEM